MAIFFEDFAPQDQEKVQQRRAKAKAKGGRKRPKTAASTLQRKPAYRALRAIDAALTLVTGVGLE
eukprot:4566348-Lingulodinium_polyedra.AAC.1